MDTSFAAAFALGQEPRPAPPPPPPPAAVSTADVLKDLIPQIRLIVKEAAKAQAEEDAKAKEAAVKPAQAPAPAPAPTAAPAPAPTAAPAQPKAAPIYRAATPAAPSYPVPQQNWTIPTYYGPYRQGYSFGSRCAGGSCR